jgi:hypothetical protein
MSRKFIFGGSFLSYVYLVDVYSPEVAYSLRKLSSTATNAIRVRRSSDNTETDIGFIGNDLDTAALLSFVGAGDGFVTTWYNQAPASKNFTQTSASLQPQIVSSGSLITRGSHAAVKFDGSNDAMQYTTGALINDINISHFSVSNNDVSNSNVTIMAHSTSTVSSIRIFNSRVASKRNLVVSVDTNNYFADMSVVRDNSSQRLLSSFINASKNMSAFDNGATGTTSTYIGSTNNNSAFLGRQGGFTPAYLNGTIQEFIAFNSDESANRTAIETNINAYYGIY